MELLLQERGYETAFEGKRYCDLKRCGKLAEYAVRAGPCRGRIGGGARSLLVARTADEFNYNTSLDPTKDQNPGY